MHEVRTFAPCKALIFYLTSLLCFRRLKITLDSEQPMLKEKRIIPSVWGGIKGFEHFQRGEYFFWLCIRLIYELISPGWIKIRFILLLVVTVTFFTCPDLLPSENQLYLCLQSKNHIAVITHQSEQTCALIKLSRKQRASKPTQDHFSVAQVIIVRVVFIFHYTVLFSSTLWKFLFFLKNNFLNANCPFHSLWSREQQLPAVTSKQLTLFP